MRPRDVLRIGAGSSFADDRIAPAVELAERGELDYLAFECLAERTIARENLARLKDPDKGYTPYLAERFQAVLPACIANGIRIVTNMGAANPLGAARAVRREAQALGLPEVPVAVVLGDDVTEAVRANPQLPLMESGEPVESLLPRMAAANAYLGADVVRDALATGAPVVMTGRVADPSLFLACMLHGLGWRCALQDSACRKTSFCIRLGEIQAEAAIGIGADEGIAYLYATDTVGIGTQAVALLTGSDP